MILFVSKPFLIYTPRESSKILTFKDLWFVYFVNQLHQKKLFVRSFIIYRNITCPFFSSSLMVLEFTLMAFVKVNNDWEWYLIIFMVIFKFGVKNFYSASFWAPVGIITLKVVFLQQTKPVHWKRFRIYGFFKCTVIFF